jgi:hypothetical protein
MERPADNRRPRPWRPAGWPARTPGNKAYRAGVAVALVTTFLLAWANLAVGLVASEDHPANRLQYAVFAVGLFGAIAARWRPRGMARALAATALAQAVLALVALVAGYAWPATILLVFAASWLASARMFRQAARHQAP